MKWSIQQNYIKFVLMLKTNKSLKLPPVDMKATSSILYEIRDGRDGTKQSKMPCFHCGPLSQSKKFKLVALAIKKTTKLYEVNTQILNK